MPHKCTMKYVKNVLEAEFVEAKKKELPAYPSAGDYSLRNNRGKPFKSTKIYLTMWSDINYSRMQTG